MSKIWEHESVLLSESLHFLNIKPGRIYVDATLGAAGHSREIVKAGGKVLGFEIDSKTANSVAEEEIDGLSVVNANFTNIKKILDQKGIHKVDGILFDLGISSDQLSDPEKGLSFNQDSKLDMRLDSNLGVTAADLVNALSEKELYELFSKYGEERNSRRIARAIVDSRREKKFETTGELSTLIGKVVGRKGKIHPATKVFMALRIAVNSELENLDIGLHQASEALNKGGRLVVISFHSLEDRLVKNFFKHETTLHTLTEEPLVPSESEIRQNPRSRSAKLRAAEKLG